MRIFDVSEDILLLKGFWKEPFYGKLKWLFFLYPMCLLTETFFKLTIILYSIKHFLIFKKR
ncbi:hypothetical protein C5695_10925 [Bacillus pumilus]|uniref:Uncharacterized protein n=1 Tax=Bacillus pumilus TaxID=1408 RepID=A0AAD0HNE0_BACPU|nr:hypothetical protein C5695_10925 [Bacillus pumilus]